MTTAPLFEEVREDLAAFADDDEDVVVDPNGQCLFVRGGEEISFTLVTDAENRLFAEFDGTRSPYRDFVAHQLARLEVLAERITTKRHPLPAYVDSQGKLEAPAADSRNGSALQLLHDECSSHAAFVSRVLFVTADAGQGKTALLRQFQHDQAQRFLSGSSGFVFWHIDLQGRQLLRLSEALMGDLGDLRVPGLWMPSVIRLLRHRALVLAIDGFDELAAEQGGSDALGALALLVQQMGDRGTIVAASRRTFFDTDDYISRARLFSRTGAGDCQFDELRLDEWGEQEGREYLRQVRIDGRGFESSDETYDAIAHELPGSDHTMLTRPFLLAQIARALLRFDMPAADFIRGMDDPYKGVGAVIEAFVKREVSEKWKQKDTGEPFLTEGQHLDLLADVAEEMFRSQRTSLSVDVIETIATLLFDEWDIEPVRRQEILAMVRMHVLLTPPDEGSFRTRGFDHEEFLAWFTAYALKNRLQRVGIDEEAAALDLLSVAQLSDATASYACALMERTPTQVRSVVKGLTALADREWRPTYLQLNVGTLIPYLLDGIDLGDRIDVGARIVYSSVVFEGRRLKGVTFRNGSFVNASFVDAEWHDVVLERCDLTQPVFAREATYDEVVFADCAIDGVRIIEDDDEETREYAPERIEAILAQLGIDVRRRAVEQPGEVPRIEDGEARKLVRRVLSLLRRTTIVSEATVSHRFPRDKRRVLEEILPLMVKFEVVRSKQWRGSGNQQAWGPAASLEEIEKADGDPGHSLNEFWRRVDEAGSG